MAKVMRQSEKVALEKQHERRTQGHREDKGPDYKSGPIMVTVIDLLKEDKSRGV